MHDTTRGIEETVSESSNRSILSSHVLRAVRNYREKSKENVKLVKCTFGIAVSIALTTGFISLAVSFIMGALLTDISKHLFLATDQALAFQTAESIFRSVGAVQLGITANPGPEAIRRQFDEFVTTVYRHEARHSELLQTRSILTSNLARDRMQKREWLLVEPSPSGATPTVFNASLQELGTHLSSVLL